MKKADIEFENKKTGLYLVVEVDRRGVIRSATQYNPAFDTHDDCLERIQASEKWCKKIAEKFMEIEWDDHGGEDDLTVQNEWLQAQIHGKLLG